MLLIGSAAADTLLCLRSAFAERNFFVCFLLHSFFTLVLFWFRFSIGLYGM